MMDSILNSPGVLGFVLRYSAIITMLWPFVSGAMNLLFYFRTPEQWVEFCERNRRMAWAFKFLRSFGCDPANAFKAAAQFFAKYPKTPPAAVTVTTPEAKT